ncbi:MAG: DEAD/DEAH box helicase family protein [Bacteroidales bacterium]|nr:DEAD/DEAH box helicase family protein [Candidatus Colicola coprequi]
MERERLLLKLRELQEENDTLRSLLVEHNIELPLQEYASSAMTQPVTKPQTQLLNLTPEEKISIFQSLFCGREDVFARRWFSTTSSKGGYQPVCEREWNPQYCDKKKYKCAECPNRQFAHLSYNDIYKHLQGKNEHGRDVIGIYAILSDNTCNFLCADFDDKSCEHGYQNDILAYVNVCQDWQIPYSIERSRSGNGAHVWIFFENPVLASKARKMGNAILSEAMNRNGRVSFRSYDRFFPNQDYLSEGGLGNLVALPLQGKARRSNNSVFVDDTFIPYHDQWAYLKEVKRLPVDTLEQVLAQHPLTQELGELSSSTEKKPWTPALPVSVTFDDFKQNLELVRSNMLYIPLASLSSKAINHFKRIAAFKNPEFYSRQAMRLSTQNTPRIISCSDLMDDYLALPRGCEDDVEELLRGWMVSYSIKDETNHGNPLSVEFVGTLRDEQQRALSDLLGHKTGVLSATTAFGKTVTAAALIAQRKTSTLILVHTKALLLQWKSTLEKFLNIDFESVDTSHKRGRKKAFSPIGCLSSDGNTLHGLIDIAVMQSCIDDNEVKPFVREYGMVVVDECHHVPAFNFEQVLKSVNARYVYGLTATPIRKDGHQPIIFMQCGPIRHTVDVSAQIREQEFDRILVSRFTSFRLLSDEPISFARLQQLLTEDESRNDLIIEDVKQAISQGRTPIVLSNLTTHVQLLAKKIRAFCPNVITLLGADSAKAKREAMTQLEQSDPNEPLVLVATGKYIGEGFDYPRLDTLFLTLPISWKGLLAQYAGRLHRDYDGKMNVQIYDYIDVHHPVCETMYRRRLKGYASIGYKTTNTDSVTNSAPCSIYNGKNYIDEYTETIRTTRKSLVISCPRLQRVDNLQILRELQSAMTRGVDVLVLVPTESAAIPTLHSKGIPYREIEKLSVRTTIVDKSLIWYGDVYFLSRSHEKDYVIRFVNPQLANDFINTLLI